MSCNRLQYHAKQLPCRDSFNLAEFVDYYNGGWPNELLQHNPADAEKGNMKELVLLRIRKHTSDIKLKKTGKTSIHSKLLNILRSQSEIRGKSKRKITDQKSQEVGKRGKDTSALSFCPLQNCEVTKRHSFHHPLNLTQRKLPPKTYLHNVKSPTLNGYRIALNQVSNLDRSLPKLSLRKSSQTKQGCTSASRMHRRYPRNIDFKMSALTPWVEEETLE